MKQTWPFIFTIATHNIELGCRDERVKTHVCTARTASYFRRLCRICRLYWASLRVGRVFRLVGYSYEDVIGPVDSFRVTHLTCDMIQTRRVVVTSSIGSSVRAISVPRPTRIASPSSSLSTIVLSLSHCSLPLRSLSNNRGPLFFTTYLSNFSRDAFI